MQEYDGKQQAERPRYALLYAALCYMGGSCAGRFLTFRPAYLAAAGLIALLCLLLVCFRRRTAWIAVFALLAIAGLARCSQALVRIPVPAAGPATVEARIEERIKYDAQENRTTYRMSHIRVLRDGAWETTRAQAYVSLPGAPEALPASGGTVRFEGSVYEAQTQRNPGGFDFYLFLRQQNMDFGIYGTTAPSVLGTDFSVYACLESLRDAIAARIDALYGEQSAMMKGMLLGDKSDMPQEQYDSFKRSGIAHLLAVSGLHVGLIMNVIEFGLDRLMLSRRIRLLAMVLSCGAYCVVIGMPSSAVRAFVMCMSTVLARAVGRDYNAPVALSLAALIILTFSPLAMFETGFVLSFSTVLGIRLLLPRVECALHILPDAVRGSVAMATAAQIAALPGQAMYFGVVPALGIPANLACIALTAVAVPLGMASVLISTVCMPVGRAAAAVVAEGLRAIEAISRFFGSIEMGQLRMATMPFPAAAILVCCFFLASPYAHLQLVARRAGCTALACAVLALWLLPGLGQTRYVQLDVGQGDAAALLTPGFTLAIDTGPEGEQALADLCVREGRSIDLLMLSHLDLDHAGGLAEVLAADISVARIGLPTGIDVEDVQPQILDALALAVARGATLEGYERGDVVPNTPGVRIEVVCPTYSAAGSNGRSMMLRIEAAGVSILATGDVPIENEVHTGVDCDILKVAHHGAAGSTSDQLLRAASPSLALISVGRNGYGHPTGELLARLAEAGVPALRTDEAGAIEIRMHEGAYAVRRYVQDRGALYDASGIL